MAKKDAEVATKKDATESQKQTPQSSFNVGNFLKETKEELDKVVWPSRQQLISESVAVVLMVFLSTTLIYLVDNFFAWIAGQAFR